MNVFLNKEVNNKVAVSNFFLKVSQISQGKHLQQNLFFDKVTYLMSATLLKKSAGKCFLVNFMKFLRTYFL